MATTAQDFIDQALLEIGVYQVGETPSSNDRATGLNRLQGMIDAWGADLPSIHVTQRTTYTLLSSTNTVTIGASGADITTTRPVWFIGINYVVPGTNPGVEVPLGQMDDDSYMNLSIKSLSSSLPTQFYYNETFPNGTLFFWPTVNQNVELALYYPLPVGTPAALGSTLQGPPGYQEAFLYGLALRLCNAYAYPVPQTLPALAMNAYAVMRRPNIQPGLLGVDNALVPTSGGAYNVRTDQLVTPSSR